MIRELIAKNTNAFHDKSMGLFRTSGLREESVAHQAVGTMQQ